MTVMRGTTHFTITVKHARIEKTRFGKEYLRQIGDSRWLPGEKLPDTSVGPIALLCSHCSHLRRYALKLVRHNKSCFQVLPRVNVCTTTRPCDLNGILIDIMPGIGHSVTSDYDILAVQKFNRFITNLLLPILSLVGGRAFALGFQ